uniref:Uncharacterized protein n=1 Tax=Macaca nemestrina TaxID=9545 RepID=A0A2K6BSF8_MACNE
MGNILTCCVCPKVSSNCGWHRGKVASSYESDIYEAVAATKSASTTVEPGKLDVGATEGHDLQHISNQKMPTASPEDNLSFVSLSRSEDYDGGGDDDDDDAQILPSRVRDGCYKFDSRCSSPEDNPSLVSLPRSEDGDCDDDDDEDDDDTQILPPRVQAWPEDRLFLRCSPRYKDDDDDDDDDVHITAWKENDLTLESISDEETYPG